LIDLESCSLIAQAVFKKESCKPAEKETDSDRQAIVPFPSPNRTAARRLTARLAPEFGGEVFGVPGNATQPVRAAPN
jgi:hypothetical protein